MTNLPNLYFLSMELIVYACFGLCLVHAWRKGPLAVWRLCAGALFGLLLELATIQQLQAYEYGRFLLMLGEVPVCIGVAWGAIIYAVRQYSDATDLPEWARPVLDALLALNIDLSMDAIAIRLGFWDWSIGIQEQYFGVPWANFWAWFWVVFFFSAGLRLLSRGQSPVLKWLAPFGAVLTGVMGVLLTNRLISTIGSYPLYLALVAGVALGALLLIVWLRPRLHAAPKPALVVLVPTAFHLYYLAAGFVSGIFFQAPVLLLVSLFMALIAGSLHFVRPSRVLKYT
jgi:hypothetical protein